MIARSQEGEFVVLHLDAPAALLPLLVEKGSVGVEGVSLTVSRLREEGFEVALIPETLRRTTLGVAHVGQPLNLESDLLAKHVARLAWCAAQDPTGLRAALSPLLGL